MFIAKCYNRPYMTKPLGAKVPPWKKICIGGCLMSMILFLIAGPMLLFSSINPVGQSNPVSRASMSFEITLNNRINGTTLTIPLFETVQLTKNISLTDNQFDEMFFQNPASTSDQFTIDQTQAMQFSPISDNVWGVTRPKIKLLNETLYNILHTKNEENINAIGKLKFSFERNSATSVTAFYNIETSINPADTTIINSLINSLDCQKSGNQTNEETKYFYTNFTNKFETTISLSPK